MKRLIILFLCAAALCAALAGCGSGGSGGGEVAIPTEELVSLAYNNGQTTLRFTRGEDAWVWADDTSFPLDSTRLEAVLAELSVLSELKPLERPEDLSVYGLDKTGRYLTTVSTRKRTTLYFGSQADNGSWYARSAGGDSVYQVPDSLIRAMEGSIYDMALLPELPAVTADNLTSVTMVWGPEDRLHLIWSGSGWRSGNSDMTGQVPDLLDILSRWQLSQCIDYTPSEGAHAVCGLAEPAVTLIVRYKNIAGVNIDFVLTVGDETDTGGRFVTISDDDTIYRMEDAFLADILAMHAAEEE